MNYVFKSKNHPEADGRNAEHGEEDFPLLFALEDKASLRVRMGRQDFIKFAACLLKCLEDDKILEKQVLAMKKSIRFT